MPPAVFGRDHPAVEDVVTGALTYRRLLIGARVLGHPLRLGHRSGRGGRRDAAERQCGRAVAVSGLFSGGASPP